LKKKLLVAIPEFIYRKIIEKRFELRTTEETQSFRRTGVERFLKLRTRQGCEIESAAAWFCLIDRVE
jgi:hypothetical protein